MTQAYLMEQAQRLYSEGDVFLQVSEKWMALLCYQKALEFFRMIPGADVHQARCCLNIGMIMLDRDISNPAAARRSFNEALIIAEGITEAGRERALSLAYLAGALKELDDHQEARQCSERLFIQVLECIREKDILTLDTLFQVLGNLSFRNQKGSTPLHFACYHGFWEMAGYLISRGAGVQLADRQGFTPLHLAAHEGHLSIVEMLLSKGASCDAEDRDGRTPLYWAEHKGRRNVVELFSFLAVMKSGYGR